MQFSNAAIRDEFDSFVIQLKVEALITSNLELQLNPTLTPRHLISLERRELISCHVTHKSSPKIPLLAKHNNSSLKFCRHARARLPV
jgi:hypothetical protein